MPRCRDVNETLRSQTETFDFKSEMRPRPSKILSRPRRDWDFQDRDQGIFRDLTYKWTVGPCFSRLPYHDSRT